MPTWAIFAIMGLLVAVALAQIVFSMMPKREQAQKTAEISRKLYRFLSRFFLTQEYIANLYSKVAKLSIYRREEIQVLVVKYFAISWGVGAALVGVGIFLFNDFLTTLICIMFAVLVANITVDKQLDKLQNQVTKAMAQALSVIRQEYLRTDSVVEALNDAEVPAIIKRPLEEISQILTANNGELKLQEFTESSPFRTMQTLAAICYHINNQGDERDVYGQSNFAQALTILLSDINNEIQKVAYRKSRFGFIEYLPFLPILAIGIMEGYFMSIMPGTALVYSGIIGYFCRTITVLSAVISYTIVSRINCNVPIKEDDRGSLVLKLMDNPVIKQMATNISPKNKKRAKLELNLKHSISRMSVEQFYLKKAITMLSAFFITIITIFSSVQLGEQFLRTSTQQLSLVATNEMDNFTEQAIQEMDSIYLANPVGFNDQQMTDMVTSYMPGLSDLQIQDQVKRMKTKASQLENAYFKWWYVWVAGLLGFIGWMIPNLMLTLRKKLIQTEEEDDFLEIQTLVSILMNTNMDTMDMLSEMAQHSRIHKDMFLYAFQGYASNPELELTRLQAKTPLIEFKRFIGKLKLTISDLSLREAYSDLLMEREHILRIRDMAVKDAIDAKRFYCGPLAMIPLGAMIIGSFLIPIGILGYHEFMGALANMG